MEDETKGVSSDNVNVIDISAKVTKVVLVGVNDRAPDIPLFSDYALNYIFVIVLPSQL